MTIQIIHLSDMHFESREEIHSINIDKMVQAIISAEKADECIIVISGDLAAKGKSEEYRYVSSFIGAILKKLEKTIYSKKSIGFICVPGNHDIDFNKFEVTLDEINMLKSEKELKQMETNYLKRMDAFFGFSNYRNCFRENKIVSKVVFKYDDCNINFVLLNTAPLSLLGGNAEDMGSHSLSNESLKRIEESAGNGINILVMHHSIEWFNNEIKDKLRKIISKKFSLVIFGHEHEPIGEVRNTNKNGNVQWVQGNALHGYAEEGNGFCSICIDLQDKTICSHSYIWKRSMYVSKKIIDSNVKICRCSDLTLKKEFLEELELDNNKKKIAEYYVFPDLSYTVYNETDDIEQYDVKSVKELMQILNKYDKIIFSGEHKSGKTALAKKIFLEYLNQSNSNLLFISAADIYKKKIEKTIEFIFLDQYENENNAFERFKQLDKSEKVVIFDDAQLINRSVFNKLLKVLEGFFGKIIILTEEQIDLDIKKQVVDAMAEREILNIYIKPFWYSKRKKLISNILLLKDNNMSVEKETAKINELINVQVKYFNLNPEFIINFVNQYKEDYNFRFFSGYNVFNIVYENAIKSKIISCSENIIDPTIVINVLREVAYYMHFGKRNWISIGELTDVANKYAEGYRQKVNIRNLMDVTVEAKIFLERDNKIRFTDHTLVAYFVAIALNQKYNQEEDIEDDISDLLKHLCFSINSDIILFLALITNNPKFINKIVDGAKKHFSDREELSFDNENIQFLLDINVPVKNSLPTQDERKKREKILDREEEEAKFSDLVELVNEYDYSDEDLLKFENQIMVSFKYLEILSKTLPAFCQNMKVEQQDEIVQLLYKCPNQFLFMVLKDIGENFEEFCFSVYEDISMLRKEKNIAEVNVESVKHMVEQVSVVLVTALYQLIATTCTSEQSIAALNAFIIGDNFNYKLQNLMMIARVSEVGKFSKLAQKLNKEAKYKIEKSLVKYVVREYLLRNDVELYGETQSLVDCFFGNNETKKLKLEFAKRKLLKKDRI